MGELRRTKRYLLRKGESKDMGTTYLDNRGLEYDYKWVAKLSSFYNIFIGGFRSGFPIMTKFLVYDAWAFYPFFLIKKDIQVSDPIALLNHERIHIHQQRDIHFTISLPILIALVVLEILNYNVVPFLPIIPFIPSVLYAISLIPALVSVIKNKREVTWQTVRENTCFERESIVHSPNADYLYTRKFWAVLRYL